IVVLRAQQRMASHFAARVYETMASVSDFMGEVDDDPELANESAAAEIRVALCLTRRAADTELAFAVDLKDRLPRVSDALAAGDVDVRRARTIAHGTAHLSEDTARSVVDRIIDQAPGLTTGQLRARVARLCIEADPEEATQRYEDAVEGRRVVCQPSESGTANLFAFDLAPDRAVAVTRRINALAQSLKTAEETRTMDQLRADVFLDLLEGRTSRGPAGRGIVDIHVDLETLARLADTPGELAGYGPVIADIVRQVTEQQQQDSGEWRFTVTDPATDQLLHSGTTRRRPSAAQRRYVEARDRTCVFPGCRMPAVDSDLDHRVPWADGGPTTIWNLDPLCRHDHGIKHRAGWTHRPLPNGDHQWTTKLGHTYTTTGKPP
ncbi:MAG TPA: HNH endonuclease, partial [Actinobacteria bacterium]|nr:HNH endonuclease [Actinomycetota bacterium]